MTIKRTVQGVGYDSGGKHKVSINCKRTKTYMTWYDMLKRCYSKSWRKNRPTYKECTVHPDWHDFQNFAEWYELNEFSKLGYELDKDLLEKGNKLYSESTVCFIPKVINSALRSESRDPKRLIGAHKVKGCKSYAAYFYSDGKNHYLGSFDDELSAHIAWVSARKERLGQLAVEWAGKIDEKALKALIQRAG